MPRSEFVELYLHQDNTLLSMIGNVVPEGFRDEGRRIDCFAGLPLGV